MARTQFSVGCGSVVSSGFEVSFGFEVPSGFVSPVCSVLLTGAEPDDAGSVPSFLHEVKIAVSTSTAATVIIVRL